MDIGGQDITIEHQSENATLTAFIIIVNAWPQAVIQLDFSKGESEAFIYKDKSSFMSWEKDGLTEENSDKMIFLTFEVNHIHCVVKEGLSQTFEIVKIIERSLNNEQISRTSLSNQS